MKRHHSDDFVPKWSRDAFCVAVRVLSGKHIEWYPFKCRLRHLVKFGLSYSKYFVMHWNGCLILPARSDSPERSSRRNAELMGIRYRIVVTKQSTGRKKKVCWSTNFIWYFFFSSLHLTGNHRNRLPVENDVPRGPNSEITAVGHRRPGTVPIADTLVHPGLDRGGSRVRYYKWVFLIQWFFGYFKWVYCCRINFRIPQHSLRVHRTN